MKECSCCHKTLPLDDFGPDKRTKDGHITWCRTCGRVKQQQYVASQRQIDRDGWLAKKRESAKRQKLADPDKLARQRRIVYLRRTYGLELEQYVELLRQQNYKCLGCSTSLDPSSISHAVDHDHATDAIRGILCRGCNLILGYAQDDPSVLLSLVNYLTRR